MKDFITIWKKIANENRITNQDMLTYCVLKTMNAKSEEKEAVLSYYLKKAYSPSKKKPYPYEAIMTAASRSYNTLYYGKRILQTDYSDIFENDEEKEIFLNLVKKAKVMFNG